MKARFSIRLALMLVILSSALGALLLNAILVDRALLDFHRSAAERDIDAALNETRASIHQENGELTRITSEIAELPALVSALNLLSNYQDPANYSAILFDEEKKKLIQHLAQLRNAYQADGVFVYDAHDRPCCYSQRLGESLATVILSYDQGQPVTLRHDPESHAWTPYPASQDSLKLMREHADDEPGIDFHRLDCCVLTEAHIPVFRKPGEQSEQLGRVILTKSIRPLLSHVSQQLSITSTVTALFDENLRSLLDEQFPDARNPDPKQLAESGRLLENERFFLRASVITLASHDSLGQLYLVARYPKKLYLEARDKSRSLLLTVMLLVGLAIIPISLALTRKLFGKPLQQLLSDVENVRGEGPSDPVRPHDSLELNHLAEAINDMTRKIRQREIELKSIVDNIPLMVFVKEAQNLSFVNLNRAGERLIGIRRDELFGKSDFDFFPREQAEFFVARDRETLASGQTRNIEEEPIETPAGTRILHTIKVPVLDDYGQPRYLLGVSEDITDKKQADENLRLWSKVFENSNEGIIITDHESRILSVNRAFTDITGYREGDIKGKTPAILGSGRHGEAFFANLWKSLREKGNWVGEIWNKHKNGSLIPVWESISAVYDEQRNITNFIGIFSDISIIKEASDKLDFLAHHDPLTGLPNRTLLNDRLKHALARSNRNNRKLAVMFLDLDQFKDINDTKGHPVGDALLIAVSERLGGMIRESDTLGRLGGDEFLIILENTDDNERITTYASRLIALFREPFELDGQQVSISASIGVSVSPDDTLDPVLLIRNADTAMYRAKAAGRNRCIFYDTLMTQQADRRVSLEQDLHHALARNELELLYQPQVDLGRNAICGAEALIRWHHAEQGTISPIEFIPIAESTGLINAIGEWVINTAIRQFMAWKKAGLGLENIAINVSPRQLSNGEFANQLWTALQHHGMQPSELEVEITEDVFMGGDEIVRNNLLSINALGVRLALDDFGTGFSSLSYLKNYPFSRLKIDRGFVRDMLEDANDMSIARSIIVLGHSLDMRIIAEGVETPEHERVLIDEQCDIGQGYLYNRPIQAKEFFNYYRSFARSSRQAPPE